MRKILWSVALTMLTITSCRKADLPTANPLSANSESLSAKPASPQVSTPTYGGQGIGLDAIVTTIQNGIVYSNQSLFANTPLLPSTGGTLSAASASAALPGISATSLTGAVSGVAYQTIANASASALSVIAGGHVITADLVSSNATATCNVVNGSASIQNLIVDGNPIVVSGLANQMIFFPTGGFVVVNDQTANKKGKSSSLTVTGLRIVVPNTVDVKIATSKAEVKCS